MRKLVCAVMSMFAMLAFTATAQASGGDSGSVHGTVHYYSDKHDDGCCDNHGNWRDDDKNKCRDDHGNWRDDDKNKCRDDHGDSRHHDKGNCDDSRDDDHGDHHNGDDDKGHHDNGDDDNCGVDKKRDSKRYALH